MENNIEKRLNELKLSFTKIIDIKSEDLITFSIIDLRMRKLKETYSDFINNNKGTLFVFGLDSFRFQSKLIDIEYDDMKRLFYAITNRMYCEYFKLFKIVIEYVREVTTDRKTLDFIKVNDNYPVYKDLEPFKQYDFEVIQNIHDVLVTLLTTLNDILINREHDTKIYQSKNDIGFNIDNFVNTLNFNNVMLREKIVLFISYMEFFHKLHHKYFKRFTTKLQLMNSQVSHDIKFEDNEQANKTKNKDMLNRLVDDEVDKKIMKEVKASITEDDGHSEIGMSPTSLLMDGDESIVSFSDQQSNLLVLEKPKDKKNIKAEKSNIYIEIKEEEHEAKSALIEEEVILDSSMVNPGFEEFREQELVKTEEPQEELVEEPEITKTEEPEEPEEPEITKTEEPEEPEEPEIIKPEEVESPREAETDIMTDEPNTPSTSTGEDEISVVTMESSIYANTVSSGDMSGDNITPLTKKKRVYKPRKKKET